jgi:hypothetical protein
MLFSRQFACPEICAEQLSLIGAMSAPSLSTTNQIQAEKLSVLPRSVRPRCGVTTRKGTPCMGQAMSNGVCWLHSGRSHVMSPEGAARKSQKAREHMKRMWAEHWGQNGRTLSDEGRAAISAAQKRRWAARPAVSSPRREGGS